jgi:hypothetical protein
MDEVKELMRTTQIAAPCSVKWEDMTGDDRARLCAQCDLHVVNTFMLTDKEVLDALQRIHKGERICMRVYRRSDGTFMTRNCPVGLQRIRERVHKVAAWIAAGLSVLVSLAANAAPSQSTAGTKPAKKKPLWQSKVSANGCGQTQKRAQPGVAKVKKLEFPIPTAGVPAPVVDTPPSPAIEPTKPVQPTTTTGQPTTTEPALTPEDVLKSKGVVEIKPAPPTADGK